jgi:hypothetical protein
MSKGWLELAGACDRDRMMVVGDHGGDEFPITRKIVDQLRRRGVRVLWAGYRLLDAENRARLLALTVTLREEMLDDVVDDDDRARTDAELARDIQLENVEAGDLDQAVRNTYQTCSRARRPQLLAEDQMVEWVSERIGVVS